jgi:tRNA dimethylallyltransferase
MLKSGLIEEVRGLVESGYGDSWALRTIGYRETRLFLEGQLTLEELPRIIVQNTMQLAKRQRTWFRRDAEVMWVHPVRDRARVIGRMREWWRAAEEVGAARNARSRQDVKN